MNKKNILIGTIVSIVVTFIFTEIFSIYHFGDVPTLLTTIYLVSIFSIFEYILLTLTYIVKKILNKEKIELRKIIGLILLFISLILIFFYIFILDIDYLHWYQYSSPFYINVIVRSVEFLLPAIVLSVISIFLLRR